MKNNRLRIYLDTSVISYYTARLHRDPVIRSRQVITREWWEAFREKADFFVSTYVLEEIADGDPSAARKRLEVVKNFAGLVSNFQSEEFGRQLFHHLNIPVRSRVDAWHLAVAAVNGQNYIVSWNFKHMANARIQKAYEEACGRAGLFAPEIVSPDFMLGGGVG
jgi:predicted nucleic acid-binding protein